MRAIADIFRGTEQLTPCIHDINAERRSYGTSRSGVAVALALAVMAWPLEMGRAFAAGPGDFEIRIGNTMPYSGPAAAYGIIGKVIAAYFDKINAEGGINGRKIKFISYDDGYNP